MKTSSAAPRSTEESRAALHERIESDFRYHSPTPEQLPKYAEIRDTARELAHRLVDLVRGDRNREAVMWSIGKVDQLYPARGVALVYRRGSTGTTYGDSRSSHFFEIELVVLKWGWLLRRSWKGEAEHGAVCSQRTVDAVLGPLRRALEDTKEEKSD